MSRSISVSMLVVFVTCASQRAAAQSPLVYNHYVPRPAVEMPLRPVYADILVSQHSLTIPAGTAFITWSVHGSVVCTAGPCIDTARFRPVIDNSFPTEGMPDDTTGTSTGSWAVHTDGGNVAVGLQVAAPYALDEYDWRFEMNSTESDSRDAMSWTLIVFPDANAGVPAVGGVGLGVLAVVLLGIGGVLVLRRRNPAPT
ncbi:MAG: hypothetical protein V1790_03525 [Planctomycetota bacterium]